MNSGFKFRKVIFLKLLLATFLGLCVQPNFAQGGVAVDVVASGGGHAETAAGSVSFTVGEPVVEFHASNGGSVSQGFQQVFESLFVLATGQPLLAISLHPNPAGEWVQLRGAKGMNYELWSLEGKLLLEGKNLSAREEIGLFDCPSGAYLLKVLHPETHFFKTFHLLKR